MDLQTENRIAAILMKEAAELRRQAEQDGVHAYLRQPNVRGRPNSRFLTATVLGVQQANRAVEVDEMWRIRQKEQELDNRLKRRQRDRNSSDRSCREQEVDDRLKRKWSDESNSDKCYRDTDMDDRLKMRRSDESSSRSYKDKRHADNEKSRSDQQHSLVEEGLKDDEIENFLNSRVKRGRGAVGSRMDETGPYLPPCQDSYTEDLSFTGVVSRKERDRTAILGPEKPSRLVSWSSSEEESEEEKHKKSKKVKKASSSKHSKKHKSKEKSKDSRKRRRKDEKRYYKHK